MTSANVTGSYWNFYWGERGYRGERGNKLISDVLIKIRFISKLFFSNYLPLNNKNLENILLFLK